MMVQVFLSFAVLVLLLSAGCRHQPQTYSPLPSQLSSADRSILAGEWEYEDGGVVVVRLDEQGNGTYEFKDGRFETTQFAGQVWEGKWYQRENDRDGGFLVNLSDDYSEGEGTWWYDRIGTNTTPSEKGGHFHLSKRASMTSLRDTPAPP